MNLPFQNQKEPEIPKGFSLSKALEQPPGTGPCSLGLPLEAGVPSPLFRGWQDCFIIDRVRIHD